MKRSPKFYTVPAGTKPVECRSKECRATIYFAPNEKGVNVPIDCDYDGGTTPTDHEDGLGVSHFITCVQADRFRKESR